MLYLGVQGFLSDNQLEILIPLILGTAVIIALFFGFKTLKEIQVELKEKGSEG